MNRSFTKRARHITRCAAMIAILAIIMGIELRAQFQTVYGGLGHEAAYGVIQTRDGNFVAVGYSTSFTNDQDVYVVKTDGCGFRVWARTYDLGGIDIGRKIRQSGDGNLIVVGSTENTNSCCTRNDAFLLRLDSDGNVLWAKSYGGLDTDDGMDVITPNTDEAITFTVAGRTNSYGAGDYDAWLFRTDVNGDLLWGRVYGQWSTDEFNSLERDCQGNIMAAGSTRSFSRGGDEDILVTFASVADGAFINSFVYGGSGDDAARSIYPSREEQFYVAGYSKSFPFGSEGYVMQAECRTGAVINDRIYGGLNTLGEDHFTELRTLPTGNLVIIGYLDQAPGGLGGDDVWLTELDANLGFVQTKVYGGANTDQGWSVAVVDPDEQEYRIIQAGLTYSFGFGRVDLYKILATRRFDGFCNQGDPELQRDKASFIANEVRLLDPRVRTQCNTRASQLEQRQYETLCTPCDQLRMQGGEENLSDVTPNGHLPNVEVNEVAVRVVAREGMGSAVSK